MLNNLISLTVKMDNILQIKGGVFKNECWQLHL